MRGLLHVLATLALLPYVLLAAAFALLGQVISAGTWGGMFSVLLTQATWLVPWGIIGFAVACILLAAFGLSARFRWLAALVLCLIACISLTILLHVPTSPPEMSGLIVLAPCIAVVVFGAWMAIDERPVQRKSVAAPRMSR